MENLTVSKTELLQALKTCIINSSLGAYLIEGHQVTEFIHEDAGSWINMYSGFDDWKKLENKEENEENANDLYNEYLQETNNIILSDFLINELENGTKVIYID